MMWQAWFRDEASLLASELNSSLNFKVLFVVDDFKFPTFEQQQIGRPRNCQFEFLISEHRIWKADGSSQIDHLD